MYACERGAAASVWSVAVPEDVTGFIAKLAKIGDDRKLANACRAKVRALKKKGALTTARRTISTIRAAIRRQLGVNHPALASFKLQRADQDRVAQDYRTTLTARHSARKRLNATAHVSIALSILDRHQDAPPLELAGALIAVTGRRPIEVLQDQTRQGDFRAGPPGSKRLIFGGQRKVKRRKVRPYSIPILAPQRIVLAAIASLRARYNLRGKTAQQVGDRCWNSLGMYVAGEHARQLSPGFHDADGGTLTPKELRAAYAAIAHDQEVRKGSRASYTVYAARVLGHKKDDLTTALSYDVFVLI